MIITWCALALSPINQHNSHSEFVLLTEEITVIKNKISVQISRFSRL